MRHYERDEIKPYAIETPTEAERNKWREQLQRMHEFNRNNLGQTRFVISNNLQAVFDPPASSKPACVSLRRETRKCLQPWYSLWINIKGDLKACCGPAKLIGNAFDQSTTIPNNNPLEALKHSLLSLDDPVFKN